MAKTASFIVQQRMNWRGEMYRPGNIIELHPADGEVLKEKNVVRDIGSPERAIREAPERAVSRAMRVKGLNH